MRDARPHPLNAGDPCPRIVVLCRHDVLVEGLAAILAPGWNVQRDRGIPDDAVALVVDADDPELATPATCGALHDATGRGARLVSWSWRPGRVPDGWPDATVLPKAASRDAVRNVIAGLAGPGAASSCMTLSERQQDVLDLLVDGLTNREIACRLHLSVNTVKTHARNIYAQLGVANRTAAVAHVLAERDRPRPVAAVEAA